MEFIGSSRAGREGCVDVWMCERKQEKEGRPAEWTAPRSIQLDPTIDTTAAINNYRYPENGMPLISFPEFLFFGVFFSPHPLFAKIKSVSLLASFH